MNLDGSAVLHADPERVWSVITDPAVLARTIPGCESLEQVGPDEYKMQVSAGVGAIRGSYAGDVRLSDHDRPKSYVMHASGAGAPGNVRATVQINLEPDDDGTVLSYSADAVVGGPVAGVGQRMISGVAKRMAGQFFKAIDDELTGAVVPIAAAPSAGAAGRPSSAAFSEVEGHVATAAEATRQVYRGRRPAQTGVSPDVQTFLLGVGVGGLLTALGVALGHLLGRRR